MNKLRQNAFWVGMGAAGVVLVALFAWKVLTLWGDEGNLQKQIKSLSGQLKGDAPGEPDIQSWTDYKGALKADYSKITGFYGNCDKALERPLPGLAAEADRGTFMRVYNDEFKRLEKELTDKKVQVGFVENEGDEPKFGFNWENPTGEDFTKSIGADERRVLNDLQKRFWIRHRVANVALQGNVAVRRIRDFHFMSPLHPLLAREIRRPQKPNHIDYPGDPTKGKGTHSGKFHDPELPDGLGRLITFGFTVDLPYSEVPAFIREFLNPSTEAGAAERLLINIIGCNVTIRAQNENEVEVTYTKDPKNPKARDEAVAKKLEEIKAKDVWLILTCQAMDFDPKGFKNFEAQSEAAPPPSGQ